MLLALVRDPETPLTPSEQREVLASVAGVSKLTNDMMSMIRVSTRNPTDTELQKNIKQAQEFRSALYERQKDILKKYTLYLTPHIFTPTGQQITPQPLPIMPKN